MTVTVSTIFPTYIASKRIDVSKLNVITTEFKPTFESNIKTSIERGQTLLDEESMNYLNVQLTELLSNMLKPFCKTFVFNCDGIWVNKYENADFQGPHIHPADFSFIIYYDTDKSNTVFNSPMKKILEAGDGKNIDIFQKTYEPNLKKGDMLLFPSFIEHWVRPNTNNKTIAGNIKLIEVNK